jgi:hypothetical protein
MSVIMRQMESLFQPLILDVKSFHVKQLASTVASVIPTERGAPAKTGLVVCIHQVTAGMHDCAAPDGPQPFTHQGVRGNDVHIPTLADDFPVG